MIVWSDSEARAVEKVRPAVTIESEELLVKIDEILVPFEDFADTVVCDTSANRK